MKNVFKVLLGAVVCCLVMGQAGAVKLMDGEKWLGQRGPVQKRDSSGKPCAKVIAPYEEIAAGFGGAYGEA